MDTVSLTDQDENDHPSEHTSVYELEEKAEPAKHKWYHINPHSIPAKLVFFFVGFRIGAYIPFMILFFTDVGLSPSKAGLIAGLRLVGSIVGSPLWGMLTDWSKRYRLVLLLAAIGSIALMLPQPWMPQLTNTVHCRDSSKMTLTNTSVVNMTQSTHGDASKECTDIDVLFYTFLVMYILISFFDSHFSPISDSVVMCQVTNSARKIDFGRQRAFLQVGVSVASVITSALLKEIPSKLSISKYSVSHFLYSTSIILLLISFHFLFKKAPLEKRKSKKRDDGPLKDLLLKTLSRFHMIFFLLTTWVLGTLTGLHISFVLVWMREFDPPNILLGLTIAAAGASNLIISQFTTKLIRFVGGAFPAITLSCLSFVVRFLVYAYASSAYWLLIIQILNGVGFTIFVVAAMQHTEEVSPKKVKTTIYGIVSGLINGAGIMVANIFGGMAYQAFGGKNMYIGAAGLSFVWAVLILLFCLWEKKHLFAPIEVPDTDHPFVQVDVPETEGIALQNTTENNESSANELQIEQPVNV